MQQGLFAQLCSYENICAAFEKAKKGKTSKTYVINFEENLKENLEQLQKELVAGTYQPKPLTTFIIRDPKLRTISKSTFRDRVVHHALCNIIEPLFEKSFIYDSYANRKGKGTRKAVKRFNGFKRKVTRNNTKSTYVLKADIKKYFENVNCALLLDIIKQKIKDQQILHLIKVILANFQGKAQQVGMPLGNLTSQFFANVYLNELDQFIKHQLKVKYYLRYVDDFVILHESQKKLQEYKKSINLFLQENLQLELHPEKSSILSLQQGIPFLGFRIFPHHQLIKKKNRKRFEKKLQIFPEAYEEEIISRLAVLKICEGWLAYAAEADTYKYRRHLIKRIDHLFPVEEEKILAQREENFKREIEESTMQFTVQKTKYFWKKGYTIHEIARQREIKEATVWQHLAKLIESRQIKVEEVLSREKIQQIKPKISSKYDTLLEIKKRITNPEITWSEINCVLASIKERDKKRNFSYHAKWYQKVHCARKCTTNREQRGICKEKFIILITKNPKVELEKREFIELFNNHLTICVLPEEEKLRFISWQEFERDLGGLQGRIQDVS